MTQKIKNLLIICCITVFFGRAYQLFFWDIPIRSLLWDQQLLEHVVTLFFDNWEIYATSHFQEQLIYLIQLILGVFFIICGIASLFISKQKNWVKYLLILSVIPLLFIAFLYFKEKFFQLGQFFEYSLQIMTPLIAAIFFYRNTDWSKLIITLKISIALTFTCHGLYAIGYYPQPGHFVDMMINTFGLEENLARNSLKLFGWLDLLLAITLFIKPTIKISLYYAVIWGLMTAMARLFANLSLEFIFQNLHQWGFEVAIRMCHGLLPLVCLYLLKKPIYSVNNHRSKLKIIN